MPEELDHITDLISSLPGIGRKSAARISFFLLQQSSEYIQDFASSLTGFHANIAYCSNCGALKKKSAPCSFCENDSRNDNIICVVEQPSDIYSIENTGDYQGQYHVLMGVLSPLDGIGPEDLRLNELVSRLNDEITEIIVATNPSIEGNATAHYILDLVKNHYKGQQPQVSRIASGLALGSQLDYADSAVISQSLKARTPVEN